MTTGVTVRRSVEWAFVLVVSSALFLYGIGKWVQFEGSAAIDKSVSELTGMELMWAFYGYSKTFPLILGFFEIAGGLLLFIPQTRIIACILITGILTNVIIQDVIYDVNRGALYAAMIYQTLTLLILWFNRKPLLDGLRAITSFERKSAGLKQLSVQLVLALTFAIALKFLERAITHE